MHKNSPKGHPPLGRGEEPTLQERRAGQHRRRVQRSAGAGRSARPRIAEPCAERGAAAGEEARRAARPDLCRTARPSPGPGCLRASSSQKKKVPSLSLPRAPLTLRISRRRVALPPVRASARRRGDSRAARPSPSALPPRSETEAAPRRASPRPHPQRRPEAEARLTGPGGARRALLGRWERRGGGREGRKPPKCGFSEEGATGEGKGRGFSLLHRHPVFPRRGFSEWGKEKTVQKEKKKKLEKLARLGERGEKERKKEKEKRFRTSLRCGLSSSASAPQGPRAGPPQRHRARRPPRPCLHRPRAARGLGLCGALRTFRRLKMCAVVSVCRMKRSETSEKRESSQKNSGDKTIRTLCVVCSYCR